jgi:hypothetical protein
VTPLRLLTLIGAALIALAVRRDLLVRGERSLDQRGGFASQRGERAYAGASRVFSGFHRRVARDAAATVGDRSAAILGIGAGPGDLLAELLTIALAAMLTGVEPSPEMRDIAVARGLRGRWAR